MSQPTQDTKALQTITSFNEIESKERKTLNTSPSPQIAVFIDKSKEKTKSAEACIKCFECKRSIRCTGDEFQLVLNKSELFQGATIKQPRRDYSCNTYDTWAKNRRRAGYGRAMALSESKGEIEDSGEVNRRDKGKVNLKKYSSREKIKQKEAKPNREIDLCFVEGFEIEKKRKMMKTEHSQIEIYGTHSSASLFQTEYSTHNDNKKEKKEEMEKAQSCHAIKVNTKEQLKTKESTLIPIQTIQQVNSIEKPKKDFRLKCNKPAFKGTKTWSEIEESVNTVFKKGKDKTTISCQDNYEEEIRIQANKTKLELKSNDLINKHNRTQSSILNGFLAPPLEQKNDLPMFYQNKTQMANEYINDLYQTQASQPTLTYEINSHPTQHVFSNEQKPPLSSILNDYFKYKQLRSSNIKASLPNDCCYKKRKDSLGINTSDCDLSPLLQGKPKHNKSFSLLGGSFIHFSTQLPLSSTNPFNHPQTSSNAKSKFTHKTQSSWIYPANEINKQRIRKYLLNMHLQTIHEYK